MFPNCHPLLSYICSTIYIRMGNTKYKIQNKISVWAIQKQSIRHTEICIIVQYQWELLQT